MFQYSKLSALTTSLIVLLGLFTGCKSVDITKYPHAPETQVFELNSVPQGASVVYDGKVVGTTPCKVELPLNYQFENPTKAHLAFLYGRDLKKAIDATTEKSTMKFRFVKDGYEVEEEIIKPSINQSEPIYYPFIRTAVNMSFDFPEGVTHVFKNKAETKTYEDDPTIVSGEAENMVTRDNPGKTALERTIIRWYFDSEPRGARVFWRVVSSIPSIVKNTNELYLGTTPYEDTRSFNILGLTYENSRDVQIEIKLTRPGYMDQVKRFNVRQAIDQQEISSFFDLVAQ